MLHKLEMLLSKNVWCWLRLAKAPWQIRGLRNRKDSSQWIFRRCARRRVARRGQHGALMYRGEKQKLLLPYTHQYLGASSLVASGSRFTAVFSRWSCCQQARRAVCARPEARAPGPRPGGWVTHDANVENKWSGREDLNLRPPGPELGCSELILFLLNHIGGA